MTTPGLWATFGSQKRQGAQILAILAVKSWEDQILGALLPLPPETDKDHAIPAKQGFQPCFFLPFPNRSRYGRASGKVHASKPRISWRLRHSASRIRSSPRHDRADTGRGCSARFPTATNRGKRAGRLFRHAWKRRNGLPPPPSAPLTIVAAAAYRNSGKNCGIASMP